jgi:hypothetical protein
LISKLMAFAGAIAAQQAQEQAGPAFCEPQAYSQSAALMHVPAPLGTPAVALPQSAAEACRNVHRASALHSLAESFTQPRNVGDCWHPALQVASYCTPQPISVAHARSQ